MEQQIAPDIMVKKLPITNYIILFIVYIVIHYLILREAKRLSEIVNKEELSNEEIYKKEKIFRLLSKWFPVIYVVFILIILY